jgi:predicted transcriptional regulator
LRRGKKEKEREGGRKKILKTHKKKMTFKHEELVLRMLSQGTKSTRIAKLLDISDRTVRNIAAGRKRKGKREEGEKLKLRRDRAKKLAKTIKKKNGFDYPAFPSARSVACEIARQDGTKILSRQTLANDLKKRGLKCYTRPKKPRKAGKRKDFAKKNEKKNEAWRKRLVFSDEHYVTTNDKSCRIQWCESAADATRRVNERRQNIPHFQIWACVGINYRSEIVFFPNTKTEEGKKWRLTKDKYVKRCLSKVVKDLAPPRIFMHDGASVHRSSKDYLERKGIEFIEDWPANSPDLNPIENVWAVLDKYIAEKHPQTHEELKRATIEAWADFPTDKLNNFVMSFLKKCTKVASEKH